MGTRGELRLPSSFPARADVVVVGGGAMGASAAFHLRRRGVRDVVLLERDALASGSTSRSAGGIRYAVRRRAERPHRAPLARRVRAVRGADRRGDRVPPVRLPLPPRLARRRRGVPRGARAAALARRAVARADARRGGRARPAARARRRLAATYCPRDGYATPGGGRAGLRVRVGRDDRPGLPR